MFKLTVMCIEENHSSKNLDNLNSSLSPYNRMAILFYEHTQ